MYSQLDVILLVGGKSSRYNTELKLNEKTAIPKSFHKIQNKYLIIHCMENFIKYGLFNFILPIGYYKEQFIKNFKNVKKIKSRKCNIFFNYAEYIKYKNKKKFNQDINILLFKTKKNINKSYRIINVIDKLNLDKLFVSYGDGVGDLNLKKLYYSHVKTKSIMTVASINPFSQYGHFYYKKNKVIDFVEKPKLDTWVNIGYFYINKDAIKIIKKFANKDLEMGALKHIGKLTKLNVYKHRGFWKSVDTLKDAIELNSLLTRNKK